MKLYTTVVPLFAAEGISKIAGKKEKVVFLFDTFEGAQTKAKELVHQCYQKVSAYRVAE